MIALLSLLLVSAVTVYVVLSPIVGRLPLLSSANSQRLLVVVCFSVAVLGALGIEAVLSGTLGQRWRRAGKPVAVLAVLALLAVIGLGAFAALRNWQVDALLPEVFHRFGFWLLLAGTTLVAAVAFGVLAVTGRTRLAALGLGALVLVEALQFAVPYDPGSPVSQSPPPSATAQWLVDHQGDGYVAAIGATFIPETSIYYGIRDVRGYDIVGLTDRYRAFWIKADPAYRDPGFLVYLGQPDLRWLAAAGVRYLVTPGMAPYPGTSIAAQTEGVTISAVPAAQPFAALAPSVTVSDMNAALTSLSDDPGGPVAVEGPTGCCTTGAGAIGAADATLRNHEEVSIAVNARQPATLVVHQAYDDGWSATIDGTPAAIHPANVLFDGIEVPPGTHTVVLR
jgi:hypothetical protein